MPSTRSIILDSSIASHLASISPIQVANGVQLTHTFESNGRFSLDVTSYDLSSVTSVTIKDVHIQDYDYNTHGPIFIEIKELHDTLSPSIVTGYDTLDRSHFVYTGDTNYRSNDATTIVYGNYLTRLKRLSVLLRKANGEIQDTTGALTIVLGFTHD